MAFAVSADAYDRFMGRYSVPLAAEFADFAGVAPPARALDVGSGPGALTTELVRRLGSASVVAVDPSESFVEAARERHTGVDVRRATAEELPFGDDEFDTALAQLVVHFMGDPVAGLREMARVTRKGGVVAACVWDHAGGLGPLSPFWDSARELEARRRASGRPRRAVRGGGARRRRREHRVLPRRAQDVRRVVGAIHPRCWAGGRLHVAPRRRHALAPAGALPRAPPRAAVHADGDRVGRARARVATRGRRTGRRSCT